MGKREHEREHEREHKREHERKHEREPSITRTRTLNNANTNHYLRCRRGRNPNEVVQIYYDSSHSSSSPSYWKSGPVSSTTENHRMRAAARVEETQSRRYCNATSTLRRLFAC